MSACRSCGAEIIWAVTQEGRHMPVDAEPTDDGNVSLAPGTSPRQTPTATVVGKRLQADLFGDDSPRYTSHFATCPQAAEHRRTR